MTGQGDARGEFSGMGIHAEARAVNNRFLKVSARVSDSISALEPKIEGIVRQYMRRGTINLQVRVEKPSRSDSYRLNEVALKSYADQAKRIALELGMESDLRIGDFLTLPGVVAESQIAPQSDEPLVEACEQVLIQALVKLNEMREIEGKAMASEMLQALGRIRVHIADIAARAPVVIDEYRNRLEGKIKQALNDLSVQVNSSEVIREIQLFADRVDIREEIVRLGSHLDQFNTVIGSVESQGRKLDFLVQEIFRETNTIGSKANDAQITRHVVEIKTMIEQVREIIQNVE